MKTCRSLTAQYFIVTDSKQVQVLFLNKMIWYQINIF